MFRLFKKKVLPIYVITWLPEAGINVIEITDRDLWNKEETKDGYIKWKRLDGKHEKYDTYYHGEKTSGTCKESLFCFLSPVNKEFSTLDEAMAYNFDDFPQQVPEEGSFIAYKFVKTEKITIDPSVKFANPEILRIIYAIAKLEIPEDARRLSLFRRNENRADKAKVLEITRFDGKKISTAYSPIRVGFGQNTIRYEVGEMAYADSFNIYRSCCGGGIYFCMTKQEAIDYSGRGDLFIGD